MTALVEDLKDFILKHNSYFTTGVTGVYLDTVAGSINSRDRVIFPADDLGNYFYLRYDGNPGLLVNKDTAFEECSVGTYMRVKLILVAFVREADNDKLFLNLFNTVAKFKSDSLVFTEAILNSDDVVLNELQPLKDKEALSAALQRVPIDAGLVALKFTLNTDLQYFALNCIENPCKEC